MLKKLYEKFRSRLAALTDKSSWFLMLPALLVAASIDWNKTVAVVTWMSFMGIIAGFCVQISRVIWGPVDLVSMIRKASEDPLASATVVKSVVQFVGVLILAAVLWARS